MPHDPNIIGPGDSRGGKQFLSGKQRKGRHKFSTTGGSAEHMYGTLPENLKSYARPEKLRQIYAAGIYLYGEDDHTEFWETVESLRSIGAFDSHMTNQFIWDNYVGNPQSWANVQSIVDGMVAGSGLEVVAWETRSLRGGQARITGAHRLTTVEEQKRLDALKHMLDTGKITQERYDKRVAPMRGAPGTETREYSQGPRKRFPDDPVGGETVWDPSGPATI
tara:strand:- start:1415 stop:2077 length:663 start_codon:yes stop_codon:yes gene_type:complete